MPSNLLDQIITNLSAPPDANFLPSEAYDNAYTVSLWPVKLFINVPSVGSYTKTRSNAPTMSCWPSGLKHTACTLHLPYGESDQSISKTVAGNREVIILNIPGCLIFPIVFMNLFDPFWDCTHFAMHHQIFSILSASPKAIIYCTSIYFLYQQVSCIAVISTDSGSPPFSHTSIFRTFFDNKKYAKG